MISANLCSTLRVAYPHELHFRYFEINSQLLRVASPASDILDSLGSFFYPYIQSHDETHETDQFYELTAIIDPSLFESLEANLPDSPDDLLTTNLKHDLEYQLRCFSSESGEITILEDQLLKLFYVICDQRPTLVVGTDGSRMRTGLLRIIRSAWMNDHDGVIVHSCVLEKHGRGIVIVGDKHAGKTTSLLQLCTKKQYGLVANDRCVLQSDVSSGVWALGVPTVINMRPETIKPFPELQYFKSLKLLGIYDLARTLNVEIKPEVKVTTLVFLSYERSCRQPAYRPLSNEEKTEMLSAHLFSYQEYEWVKLMKIGGGPSKTGAGIKSLQLSSVSGFHLISNENQLDERALLLDSWCQAGA